MFSLVFSISKKIKLKPLFCSKSQINYPSNQKVTFITRKKIDNYKLKIITQINFYIIFRP